MTARSDLEVRVKGRDELTPDLQRIESRLIRFVGAVSSALTAFRIASFPVNAIRTFEAGMANVQKTTGFTDREIKKLSGSLVNLSRRINVSAEDLAAIAAAAGQQGLGREGVAGIEAFTESVSRMAAVLDVTAEDASANIGKIASIFKIPLREIERAVSSFNETSNNSTATGEQLLDVVKRIGDAAGSLNLAQSIGLSATGIDLGLSPEVVGSSFQKIFAEMYGRADQFANLLGVSVNDWIQKVQAGGIDALKEYLVALRKLDPAVQQQQIKALSGGGRIGALVTKLVQDVEDAVLDKNVSFAEKGFAEATSAIKEQQTVLETLDAQIVKAGNSFQALGIIAGERFAGPLAAYFAQLNEGLAQEGVIKFAEAVGDSFLNLFNAVAKVIQVVASLNVNWENFITFGTIFIGLKLAQVFSSLLFSVTGMGKAWDALAGSATRAADAQANAGKAGRLAIAMGLEEEANKLKALMAQRQAYKDSIKAQEQAVRELSAAQEQQAAAEAASIKASTRLRDQRVQARTTGNAGIDSAKQNLAEVEQRARQQQQSVALAFQTRMERAEADHTRRVAAIHQAHKEAQAIARANNDRSALLAATRARNEQLAAEEATQTRSLRSIQAYYGKRLSIVNAATTAEVNAAKAALAASLSEFDGKTNNPLMGKLTKDANAAAAALAVADANLKKANLSMSAADRAAKAAAAGYMALGNAARFVGVALQGLMRIAGVAFFWLTMVYTVLESLGVIDKIAAGFQKFTDSMGYTSEASRKLEQRQRELTRAQIESNEAMQEAIELLDQYIDKSNNKISDATSAQLEALLSSEDVEEYRKGIQLVEDLATGLAAKVEAETKTATWLPLKRELLEEEADQLIAGIAKAEDDIKAAQERMAKNLKRPMDIGNQAVARQLGDQAALKAAQKNLEDMTSRMGALQEELSKYSNEAGGFLDSAIADTEENLNKLKGVIRDTFTTDSADVFMEFMPQQLEAIRAVEAAQAAMQEANKQAGMVDIANDSIEIVQAAREAQEQAQRDYEIANGKRVEIARMMATLIAEMKASGGLSEATVGSLDYLADFFNMSSKGLATYIKLMNEVKESGEEFTGRLAPPQKGAPTGTGTADTDSESELRRQRRARLELVRAGLQAEANLLKDANDQKLAADEYSYERSLIAMREYFTRRRNIEEDNLNAEIRLKKDELSALRNELGEATQESERLRTQASIVKAEGEVAVLNQQRASIRANYARDLERAMQQFTDRVTAERRALSDYFGAVSDTDAFTVALQDSEAQYRDWIARLRIESANMPELTPLIDMLEARSRFEAVEAGLQSIATQANVTAQAFEQTERKLNLLRDAGLISRGEFAALEERNRKAVIALRQAELERSRAMLAQAYDQNRALDDQSIKYQQLALQISGMELELMELEIKSNQTSDRINNSLKSAIEGGLSALSEAETIRQAFTDMLLSVVYSIRDVAAEGLSDILMKSLTGEGGGLGGMLAGFFGETDETLSDQKNALDVRGVSPVNALWTRSADGPQVADVPGIPSMDAVTDKGGNKGVEKAVGDVADEVVGLNEGFATTAMSLGGTIVEGFLGGFGQMGNLLLQVGQMIVTALTLTSSTSAVSGIAGAAAGAAAAHNGGIAGRTTMTRTNISSAVFANAARYHTGGKAGLSANEVPVILEKGEEILTKQDPRHIDNLGSSSGGGEPAPTPIFDVHPVLSEGAVLDAMKGASGRQLLLVHIGKNPGQFRSALKL